MIGKTIAYNENGARVIIEEENEMILGLLEDNGFAFDFIPDPRDLNEIDSAINELFDKIWYNRHLNLLYRIATGEIQVDPTTWKTALRNAQRIEQKYENLGPWDDFEWGMLNGKFSALRWVVGDEWDMLDT
jgi:hypothetical protein